MTHAESWSITPTAAHGRKAPTNNCKKYIGQNKSGKSGLCLATKPYTANFQPVLSSFGIDHDHGSLKGGNDCFWGKNLFGLKAKILKFSKNRSF